MKRNGLFVIAIIFAGLFLSSCATAPETRTQYYSFEWFRISIENFNSVPDRTENTFEAVLAYIEHLRRYSAGHLLDGTDITENDLREFLAQTLGLSQEFIDANISYLRSLGNVFFIFEYLPDNNYLVIMYYQRM